MLKLSKEIIEDKNLTDGEKILLAYLKENADEDDIVFEHFNEINEKIGCSRQTITNRIHSLKKKGYIEVYSKYKHRIKKVKLKEVNNG
mgnify:CR=1 FL=1